MSTQRRLKLTRYTQRGLIDPNRKWQWRRGLRPRNVQGQSGRSVLIVNSGIFEVTAAHVGTHDSNRYVGRLTEHHVRVHRVPETHYGVYFFSSKRAMHRWLLRWHRHRQGSFKPKLRDFVIEWLR